MRAFIKIHAVFFLVITAFIALKIPYLFYPYFWDESWSYAPGVQLMFQHGPSLSPSAIDSFYSRGHPLLFYASAASWMLVWGKSALSLHSFALFLSVALLATIYYTVYNIYSKNVGIIATILFATQILFFVQSTLLLPEVMLALWSLLALYSYVKNNHWMLLAASTALLFTKESGAIIALIIGMHALWRYASVPAQRPIVIKLLGALIGACASIGLFFLVQKQQLGWYFYPLHLQLIQTEWLHFKGTVRFELEILLLQQNRIWISLCVTLGMIAHAIKTNNKTMLFAIACIVALLYIFIFERFGYITRKALMPAIALNIIYILYMYYKSLGEQYLASYRFSLLALLCVDGYLIFSGYNFFTNRYLLVAMVFLTVILAGWIHYWLIQLPRYASVLMGLVLIISGWNAYRTSTAITDCEMGAFPAMRLQEAVVNYCIKNKLQNYHIATPSNMEYVHLTNALSGFLGNHPPFKQVTPTVNNATELYIIDNIETDTSVKNRGTAANQHIDTTLIVEGQPFQLLQSIRIDSLWAAFYKKLP